MHDDQLDVSPELVRALVAAQFPQWSGADVRRVQAEGTVNAVFRIGDDLTARLPLRPGDPAGIARDFARERDGALKIARHSRFPVPQVLATGTPGPGYPLPWVIQTWLDGTTATDLDPAGSPAFARDLADFIEDVRGIDTGGRTFSGGGRGGDLKDHDAWMETCFAASYGILDVPYWRGRWKTWRELPREAADVMSHGDLIGGNVLVSPDLGLAGVLDLGSFGPADPALDLIGAWSLLDRETRPVLRRRLAAGDLDWERGRAWAFEQAMGLVWYYERSNPVMSALGRRMLTHLRQELDTSP
ncbi:phosphotransferase [Kineosporia succinea]|uniref:Aminoglycoside phosphotransferase (APT) family kinase protein n=1 Tax=Kineosporia succinea TaxID=84632 RepID=A0ABT9NZ23_9ACTN|nr:phosphotransferase [Kineosporia succinea]MDP9825697.1 aminoglycoside phosphotransferase (APT) family kinase protein [Kineosporia succinea]